MSSPQHVDECEIRLWRGYVKSCFFAADAAAASVQASPLFWSLFGSGSVEPLTEAAAVAHRTLVEGLLQQGWRPAGVGERPYQLRFQRRAAGTKGALQAPEPGAGPDRMAEPAGRTESTVRRPKSERLPPARPTTAAPSPARKSSPKRTAGAKHRRVTPEARAHATRPRPPARVKKPARRKRVRRSRGLARAAGLLFRMVVITAEAAGLLALSGS